MQFGHRIPIRNTPLFSGSSRFTMIRTLRMLTRLTIMPSQVRTAATGRLFLRQPPTKIKITKVSIITAGNRGFVVKGDGTTIRISIDRNLLTIDFIAMVIQAEDGVYRLYGQTLAQNGYTGRVITMDSKLERGNTLTFWMRLFLIICCIWQHHIYQCLCPKPFGKCANRPLQRGAGW